MRTLWRTCWPHNDQRPRRGNAVTSRRSSERGTEAPALSVNVSRSLAPVQPEPVIVVIQCESCGRFAHPRVQFDAVKGDTVTHLPANCVRCGHPLDTYETIRDVIATAHHLAEGIRVGGLAS